MLEELDAVHVVEWMAFFKIEAEEMKRAELASRAEAGVRSYKRGGR